MGLFKRKRKPGNPNAGEENAVSISASQDEEPLNIVVVPIDEPPARKITQRMLQATWPKAIDRVTILNDSQKRQLKKRSYALSLVDYRVMLYLDDKDLYTLLQQAPQYQSAIADALISLLGGSLRFEITDIITFDMDEPAGPPPIILNDVDRKAQGLFQKTNLYSLFNPQDGSVYSLPLKTPNLELHWFRVRKNVPPGEYFDAFCLAAPSQASHPERTERRLRNAPPISQVSFTQEVLDDVSQQVLGQVTQEGYPVSRETFFLFVPAFPQAGAHLLTQPFDFAINRFTPIPLSTVTLDSLTDAFSRERLLLEVEENWRRRKNRYFQKSPATGEEYYRQDMIEATIRDCIRQGHAFGLFGPRRMGKTSVLLEMQRKQAYGNACVSVFNLQEYLGRPIWAMLRDAIKDWKATLAPLLPEEAQRQELTQINPDLAYERQDIGSFTEQMYCLLHLLPEGMRLVLILDEVGELLPHSPDYQKVNFAQWREFLANLRAVYFKSKGRHDQVPRFVLGVATYKSDINYNNFGEVNRNPWLRQLKDILLGPLSRADCDRMVQDIGAMAGLYYTPEVLQLLYEEAYGHPQITRELCNALAERVSVIPHRVEREELQRVIDLFVRKNETIRAMYRDLEPMEKEIAKYLAQQGETGAEELCASLGEQLSDDEHEFDATILRMEQYGLVQKNDETGMVRLTFGLFRKYLKN